MKFALPLLALLIYSCTTTPEVTLKGDLEIGSTITGTLEQEVAKSYTIEVEPNTYITGYANQISVDVVVTLFDSEDNEVGVFDSPARGPEPFNYSLEEGGTYRLEIAPFEEESGDYSLTLNVVEPIATDPNKRADQLLSLFSNDNPGAVIGIIRDGKMVYSKAYGKANLTHDLDFKLNTPTNIGSVSKQFTSYAVLLLEARGMFSIDDDIRDHFPELPDYGEVITIANLMNHTNGFREVYNLMPIAGWNGEDYLRREEVINILKNQTELQNAPNSEFNYNNSAYIMLAELVERKTDTLFPQWMQHNVFAPLGMNNSYVRKDPSQIIPGASQGYSAGEDGFVENGDLYAAYGAGGIYTTPEDLAKWLANFNQPTVGTRATIDKLTTPRVLVDGDTLDYAFGIGVGEYKGLKRYAHSGADIAHRAMVSYYPEHNAGVITLSNNAGFSTAMNRDLVDLFFSDLFTEEEEESEEEEDAASETVVVAQEILERYAGNFKFQEVPMSVEFRVEEGVLTGEPAGQEAVDLTPKSDSVFVNDKYKVEIVFKTAQDGSVDSASFSQGEASFNLDRIPPFNPDPEELQDYTGRYFCNELETFYTIKVVDSVLTAIHKNMEDFSLSAIDVDQFNADVFFMEEVNFTRDSNGNVNGFQVSNGRTKGIVFIKQ